MDASLFGTIKITGRGTPNYLPEITNLYYGSIREMNIRTILYAKHTKAPNVWNIKLQRMEKNGSRTLMVNTLGMSGTSQYLLVKVLLKRELNILRRSQSQFAIELSIISQTKERWFWYHLLARAVNASVQRKMGATLSGLSWIQITLKLPTSVSKKLSPCR